ncbi:hypothetical protein KIN20_017304 [Parelaphostrongylus tenuis]|uniref:Uncharacterized protein n=1 Tax=Parelaphostrongylus tenuis TaxID=148309 RepID=A0AAD5MHS7_PARTN|nr:hypothetical protein KIN20_017304 [Parelaphostrongylus tenuis]
MSAAVRINDVFTDRRMEKNDLEWCNARNKWQGCSERIDPFVMSSLSVVFVSESGQLCEE